MIALWYKLCELTQLELLQWDFMKNALLAILLIAPLYGLISTMIVSGKMSFFSDALGHSAFTGIAIGCICGFADPIWVAVILSIIFSLLFSFVKNKSSHGTDTIIGVFSSTAVALGIFIATFDGGSFTKFNKYLIGDILSVNTIEILLLFIVLVVVLLFWLIASNRLVLGTVCPQIASTRGISVGITQTYFTAMISVIVTLSISWVGLLILNSLLVLPGASARNVSSNLRKYHMFSVLFSIIAGILGLVVSYYIGTSTGASISLILAAIFVVTFLLRKVRT